MRTDGSRRLLLLQAVEGCRRGEEQPQADVDEVDARDRERDVAGEHDALVEHAVDELDERHLGFQLRPLEDAHRVACSRLADPTKLYGGHGPVTSKVSASGA